MTKSALFTAAHKIAKQTVATVGNYMIAFSLALKSLYQDAKMETTTKKVSPSGNTEVIVKLKRYMADDVTNLDGHEINHGSKFNETLEVWIHNAGEKLFTRGRNWIYKTDMDGKPCCRFGDKFLHVDFYDLIISAINEAEANHPVKKITKTESAAKKENFEIADQNQFGYCNKCNSYCYGDCSA